MHLVGFFTVRVVIESDSLHHCDLARSQKYGLQFQLIKKKELKTLQSPIRFITNVFYYETCFGRHTAHHQEPKTAQAASGFAYVEGYRTCPTTFHVWKTRGCLCSFRLLMMGGVSLEACWASFKIRNNKNFYTLLHLVGFFTVRILLWCTDPRTSSHLNICVPVQ